MRTELHAFVGHLAQLRQAHHLEAAAVGQDRTGPAHEAVEPAQLADHLGTGPQVQVIGVGEQDVGAGPGHLIRGKRLHRGLGADRHERRGQHFAVKCAQSPCAGSRRRVFGFECVGQGHGGRIERSGARLRARGAGAAANNPG
jgi:hypothetical protein